MCQLRGRTICEKSLLVCLEIADLESRRTERRFYVRPSHLDTVDRRFMTFDNYLVSLDHTQFHEYTRLTPQEFAQLHSRLAHRLEHLSSHRMPVSSHHRLAITLRFLGHGASFVALAHEVRLGRSTAMKIVYECCRAIIDEFWSETFPVPSAADWQRSADQFRSLWRYPRGVGSIDGKHFRCYAPRNSGSANFNYKGYFSIVLLAVVNGGYRILAFDLGGRGRNSDSALFRTSPLKRFLEGAVGQFPYGGDLAGEGHVDYHILADGGFAQATWMQRPFRQAEASSDPLKGHFNECFSSARRIVESVFGIICARFRVFQRPLIGSEDNCKLIIAAALVLHNLLARDVRPEAMLRRFPPLAAPENREQFSRALERREAQDQRLRMVEFFAKRDGLK